MAERPAKTILTLSKRPRHRPPPALAPTKSVPAPVTSAGYVMTLQAINWLTKWRPLLLRQVVLLRILLQIFGLEIAWRIKWALVPQVVWDRRSFADTTPDSTVSNYHTIRRLRKTTLNIIFQWFWTVLVQIAKVSISTLVPVRQRHVNGIFTSLSTVAARKIWEVHPDASSITPELPVWSKSRFTLFRLKCTFNAY